MSAPITSDPTHRHVTSTPRADTCPRSRALLQAGLVGALATLTSLIPAPPAKAQGSSEPVVNIYTYREPALIQGLLATFSWTTGIKTNLVHAPSGLIDRIVGPDRGKADLILTNDESLLHEAKAKGATEATRSERLATLIPPGSRDRDLHWFGLSRNPRALVASRARVGDLAIRYDDLAAGTFKGRICTRSGSHRYNLALTASMIAHLGEAKAETWLKGLKANLVRKPEGGDRDQIQLVLDGRCDIAIVNSYYFARGLAEAQGEVREKLSAAAKLIFPNATDRGTHTNTSGMALAASAPNRENAIRLMEFLGSHMGQQIYVNRLNEFAVIASMQPESLKAYGQLKADPLTHSDLTKHLETAKAMTKRVGFDD